MSLGDFVVLNKIGEGAYSSVHKVKRISDGLIYALKKVKMGSLKEKEKQNALNEVRLLASINADYIVKYKEAFFDPKANALCIVIEFADGGDLEKLIEKKKRSLAWVEEKEIWTMMRQVLSGLAILHERNIIHRDLKCANIFIANGDYKIADLNVSKLLKKELAYTQTGTPYYASPEVWQDKPYELKSDIWSFGCIVYELCALKPPFTGNNMEGLFRKVMRGVYPKIPSTYSDKMAKAIDLCLQLDPAKRPTAKELLKFIDEGRPEPSKSRISSINLLNTIKLPKNYDSWKDELPKADYETSSDRESDSDHPKYGQISQNRLREIVRSKNEESIAKKETVKKINPEVPTTMRQELKPSDKPAQEKQAIRRSGLEGLPRLKMHSEPNDRVNELLAKLKEEERRRVDYSKPAWWG